MKKIIVLIVVMLAVAGCGRRNIDAPTPTSAVFQKEPTQVLSAADAARAQQAALVANGEVLFNTFYEEVGFACETCHFVDQETMKIGPGLLDISDRAGERVDGQDADTYLHNSIINPNEFIVDTFTANLMPQTYGEILSEDEVDALVAYLMSLES